MSWLRAKTREGFTLLEVMVAIGILALALTAIFSSEAGAIKVAARSRTTNVASMLGRCKMAEIEEQVAEEGLPAVDDQGSDECCEDAEQDGFTCDWRIDRVVLPDQTELESDEGGPLGGAEGDEEGPGPDLSKLTDMDPKEAGPEQLTQMLGGASPQDALAQMAFDFGFPLLKPAIEEQVRRATVTVKWKEGVGSSASERSFDIVQFLVAPSPAAAAAQAQDQAGQSGQPPQSSSGGGKP